MDARRCISYLTIEHKGAIDEALEPLIGDWTFGCDLCQEVCPFNEPRSSQPDRAAPTTEPGFLNTQDWPALSEIVELPHAEWDRLTQGSAVRRAGREGLARNARINLGNLDATSGTG